MRLINEDHQAFHIQHPSGMTIRVPKNSVSEATHQKIRGLPKIPSLPRIPHLAHGTPDEPLRAALREPEGHIDPETREYVVSPAPSSADVPAEVNAPPPESALSQPDVFGNVAQPPPADVPPTSEASRLGPMWSAGQPPPMPVMAGPPEAPGGSWPQVPGGPNFNKLEADAIAARNMGMAGADTTARAAANTAEQMVGHYQSLLNGADRIEKERAERTAAVQAQTGQLESDIANAKIDPNHFWSTKDTGHKIMTGLGLILSGMGAGMTGGPNLAAQFLQRNIDRDVEAQKADLGKKENLLGMMYKKYGNIQDAAQAAKAHLMTVIAGQTGLAAAQSGNLQAQGVAQMAKSQLMQGANSIFANIEQGRSQYDWQKYQVEMQRRFMNQMASPMNDPNYIPSGAHPPTMGGMTMEDVLKAKKDDNERRVNLPEVGALAYTHAGTAKQADKLNESLPQFISMERNINIMKELGREHPLGINAPWPTAAKRRFDDAARSLNLSFNALYNQQRFTHEENQQYQPMLGKSMDFLLSDVGQKNMDELLTKVQMGRQADYNSIGLRMGPRPVETPMQGAR